MAARVLLRLRKLALGLPDAHEAIAWGTPTFRVRNKLFAMYAAHHHGDERIAVWVKATHQNQELVVRAEPERFFIPPYVGASGWIGVVLDGRTDWEELGAFLADGYRMVAPKRLLARLDDG
jgi:hypothetical protein